MTRRRRGLGLSGILVALLVAGVVVTAAGIFPLGQIIDQQEEVDLAVAQLEALEAENRRLEAQILALQTPEEVERLARERFGLVMPGEDSYVVVVPEGAPTTAPAPEPTFEVDERPWWRRLLDFVTGRDLLEDG